MSKKDLSIAIINSLGKAPNIHSFAHGGITYKLPLPNYGASKSIYNPVDADVQWSPMVSFEEAQDRYNTLFRRFLKDKVNLIIAGTGGTGKTHLILQLLLELPQKTKVLILCHNHEKANELRQDLSKLYSEILDSIPSFSEKYRPNRITFFSELPRC